MTLEQKELKISCKFISVLLSLKRSSHLFFCSAVIPIPAMLKLNPADLPCSEDSGAVTVG